MIISGNCIFSSASAPAPSALRNPAVMPNCRRFGQSAPDIHNPQFNLLFFGDFTRLSQQQFSAWKRSWKTTAGLTEPKVREIYLTGNISGKRNTIPFSALWAISFIIGLFASLLGFIIIALG